MITVSYMLNQTYFCDHRVYRVPGFFSSRPNWVPTPPHPLLPCGGGTHSLAGERVGGSQFGRVRVDRHCGTQGTRTLYVYVLFGCDCCKYFMVSSRWLTSVTNDKQLKFPFSQWLNIQFFKYRFLIRFKKIRGMIYFLHIYCCYFWTKSMQQMQKSGILFVKHYICSIKSAITVY